MPVIIKDVTEQLKTIKRRELEGQRKRHEPRHNDQQATIKSLNGSTSPAARPGKTWVAFHNQPESLQDVWNPTSLSVAETHVWVGPSEYPPFALAIKGPYQGGVDPGTGFPTSGGSSGIPNHGGSHQLADESNPGASPTLTYQPMLQMLKTTGDGSTLVVLTFPHIYFYEGSRMFFGGKYQTLSSYVPASGYSRRVLIYLNPILNQTEYVAGTAIPTGSMPIPYPTIPEGTYPSAFVTLSGGQTDVTTATDVEDARDFLRARQSMESSHSILGQADGLHSPYRWVWDDLADRLAETDVIYYDIVNYTVGIQLDTGQRFRALTDTPTWTQINPNLVYLSRHITNHVDGTWYSLYVDGTSEQLVVPSPEAWTVDVAIVGKTNLTFGLNWHYHIWGGVANNDGTVIASFKSPINTIWEADSAYDVRLVGDDTNNALDIQVRRNSGDTGAAGYGEMSVAANTSGQTLATPDQWYQVTQFDTNGNAGGTTPDHTNDRILVSNTGLYKLSFSASFSGTSGRTYIIGIYVGGVLKTDLQTIRYLGTGTDVGSVSITGLVDIADGNYVEVYAQGDLSSASFILEYANLNLVYVGEIGGQVGSGYHGTNWDIEWVATAKITRVSHS